VESDKQLKAVRNDITRALLLGYVQPEPPPATPKNGDLLH